MDRWTRVTCFVFLAAMFFLGVALMVFGMEMRHSRPGPGFDPYYLECCAPAVFFGLLLLAHFLRFPTPVVVMGLIFSGVVALAWMAYEFRAVVSLLA